jgi:uncharacterized membrane protein YcaP (DUF421 family)
VEAVIRGALVYIVMLTILRLSGRRTMAQLTPFDFVLLLIVAETTQQALLGDDFSITNAVILILTLFLMDIGFSYLKRWFPGFAKVVDGQPTVLICDGQVDERALLKARVSKADIAAAARSQHGLESLDDVQSAVLENDAGISIIPVKN